MPHGRCCSAAQVTQLKRLANKAQRDAQALVADESTNRSTRTRGAYKVKAVALEKIHAILNS